MYAQVMWSGIVVAIQKQHDKDDSLYAFKEVYGREMTSSEVPRTLMKPPFRSSCNPIPRRTHARTHTHHGRI